MARTRKLQLLVIIALATLGVTVSLALQATPGSPREVRLEARGMAFYLEGGATANPAIEAAPGERLRLVLVNRDLGFEHDLRLPELGAATGLLGDGESGALTLRVPTATGEYRYDCSLHARMMAGSVVVR
jgi:hypothetical protein